MVHSKPVTDGHVLICPTRPNVYSMAQLTELEVLEIFVCAREVCRVFDEAYQVKNFMILISEGDEQYPTFCIQVLPRERLSRELPENAHSIGSNFRSVNKNRTFDEMYQES